MFKFIYATDLHGDCEKFEKILQFAIEKNINLIHLGADFLPKYIYSRRENILNNYLLLIGEKVEEKKSKYLLYQQDFIKNFFINFYQRAKQKGIKLLVFFGNDDLYCLKPDLRSKGIKLLDENSEIIEDYNFFAYQYVCDTPFGLKFASKLDYKGWKRPECEQGIEILKTKIKKIYDIDFYLRRKSTIANDLKKISVNNDKTIISFHMPPNNLDLDVCYTRKKGEYKHVGSESIYKWIEKEQPLLTLHGHIHESYDITGKWVINLGKSLVIQPGQAKKLTRFTILEIENEKIHPYLIEI